MLWCEVRLSVPLSDVEAAAEVLRGVAPGGVSIEEPVVPLGPEEGVRLEVHRPAIVLCYLPVDDSLGAQLEQIDVALAARGIHPPIETRRVDEAEWADAWKEHFQVQHVGEHIVIRPSWREYVSRPADVLIDLDPGMAFGTGQHETTRGSLTLLERFVRPGMRVLDVGTGSGILAIAAVKLGAHSVLAVDTEAQSVSVARENAERNGVAGRVQAEVGSLGARWPFTGGTEACADLVVANIHARVLLEFAEALAASLTGGGTAILSGIIAEREADVIEAYTSLGLSVVDRIAEGDWRTLALCCGAVAAR